MNCFFKTLIVSCLCITVSTPVMVQATVIKSPLGEQMVVASEDEFENVAITQVTDYVNIRQEPNTQSAIMGKIYNNSAAKILATVEGEDGDWYEIQSGTVHGYIKSSFFATGEEAEQLVELVGKSYITINTDSLRLREEPNLESETLTLLTQGAKYITVGEEGDFYKITIDDDLEGYLAKEFCVKTVEFDQALSMEEERQLLDDEAQRKFEATLAMAQLEEVIVAKNPFSSENTPTYSAPPSSGNYGNTSPYMTSINAPNQSTEITSATRNAIVAYSMQFLGAPYVYGGTSVTEGIDCSAFVQYIYKQFGIETGRTSRDQAVNGREISFQDVEPGDLYFYESGGYINHVTMYIGNGNVIHASNPRTGVTISPYNYRTPCKAVTFLR